MMRKRMKKAGVVTFMLICMGIVFGCASNQKIEEIDGEKEITQVIYPEEELQTEKTTGEIDIQKSEEQESKEQETEEGYSPERQRRKNEERFFKEAEEQKIDRQTAEHYWQTLTDDNLFKGGEIMLTGLKIGDIDGNGQVDMLVRTVDVEAAESNFFYGFGGLWFYMNDDVPYCFSDELCPYYGDFELFWADIDNDENVEIVFEAQGTGVGATGDMYKAVFKYKNHDIEQMKLPSDIEAGQGEYGLFVEVIQEAEQNSYSAYCPYFDERISFHAENIEGQELPAAAQSVGGNVRGFYDLCVAEYQGKKALQASEYLMGEGKVSHNVATAQFLITWREDGTPKVVKWWIEENINACVWASAHENRICYMDGYYYYASQSDHYFLYRVKADGSSPQCLAKVHAGEVCAQDGVVYFVNLSDDHAIYRINADGSKPEKLCEFGYDLQISAEYVFFCNTYDSKYITPQSAEVYDRTCLYRMKKDGLEKTLITGNFDQYVLCGRNGSQMRYSGTIYCSRRDYGDEGTAVYKMDLNGQNLEEVCYFTCRGKIAVQGDDIYCVDYNKYEENLVQFCMWSGEMESVPVSYYTDYSDAYHTDACDTDSYVIELYHAKPYYKDYCFYKGSFYGLCEQIKENLRIISISRVDLGSGCKEIVYEKMIPCENRVYGQISDLYATQQGIFFRRFVSEQEGCRWFGLTEDKEEWELEDKETIPVTMPAEYIEYGADSVLYKLESEKDCDAYVAEDLTYEEFYAVSEDGYGNSPYRISLPQFNGKIAGYKKINRYFQEEYRKALVKKEEFFKMLAENNMQRGELPAGSYQANWFRRTGYACVFVGEKYITVGQYESGYSGGNRNWASPSPVTFDRTSGEMVSLETILGMTTQEAVARLTGAVYKHKERIGDGRFLLRNYDILTETLDPQKFFLFPEGIGIYYRIGDIDCMAAGDFLFVVPWEDFDI